MQPSRTWKALLAGISANIQAEFATPTQQIIDPPQRKIPAGKRGQGWAKFVLSEPCRRDYPQKKPISAVPIAQENLKDCEILVDKHMHIWLYCHIRKGCLLMQNKHDSLDPATGLGRQFYEYIQKIRDDRELYKLKAQVAKALAHESRLMIIDALHEKDMCVGELTQMVGVDQSTVSKHLSVLKQAGIIMDHKAGSNRVYYHLRNTGIRQFSDLAMALIQSNIPRAGFHAVRNPKV
jgi:ArsR family transcriptional regulator, arsenate/arsenite/antimonite-responsive transcriptional repressor